MNALAVTAVTKDNGSTSAPNTTQDGQRVRRGRKPSTDSVRWLEAKAERPPYRQQLVLVGGSNIRIA